MVILLNFFNVNHLAFIYFSKFYYLRMIFKHFVELIIDSIEIYYLNIPHITVISFDCFLSTILTIIKHFIKFNFNSNKVAYFIDVSISFPKHFEVYDSNFMKFSIDSIFLKLDSMF